MNISLQTLRQAVTPLFHENVFGINPSVTLGVMAAANTVFLFMVDSTIKRHFIDETKPRTYTKIFLTESLFAGSCAAFNYLLSKVLQVQLSVVSFAIITATAVSFHLLLNRLFGGQKATTPSGKPAQTPNKVEDPKLKRLERDLDSANTRCEEIEKAKGEAETRISDLEGQLAEIRQKEQNSSESLNEKTREIQRKEKEIADLKLAKDKLNTDFLASQDKHRTLESSLRKLEEGKNEAEAKLENALKDVQILQLQSQDGDKSQTEALNLLKTNLAEAQLKVLNLQGEKDRLNSELAASKEKCQQLESSLERLEGEKKKAEAEKKEVEAELQKALEAKRNIQTDLGKVREDLRQKNHKLDTALQDLAKQKQMTDRAERECRGRENQVGELRSEIFDLQAQLEGLREQFASLAPPPVPAFTEPEAADDSTTASSPGQSTSSQPIIEASETRSLVNTLSSLGGLGLGDDDGDGYEYEEGYEEGYEQEQPSVQLATPQHASTQSAAVAKKSPELPRILEEMKEFETNFLASLKKCQQQRGLPQRKDADPVNDAAVWQIIKKMIVVSTEFLESTKQHGAQATFLNSDLIDRYFLAIEEMINSPEPEKTLAFQRAARQDLLLKRLAKSDDSVSAMSQWVNNRVLGFNEVERAREIKQQMDDLTQKLGQLRAREEKKEKMKLRISEFGKTTEYILDVRKRGIKKAETEVKKISPETKKGPSKTTKEAVKTATITNDSKQVFEKILDFLDSLPNDYTVNRLHCLNNLEQSTWWKETNKKLKTDKSLLTKLQQLKKK